MFELTTARRPAILPVQIGKSERRYTLEEYLNREERSQHRHEFIDGKIIRLPMAKGPHNIISANVIAACKAAFKKLDKKYVVLSSNQKIYFPAIDDGVYPDALAVCDVPQYFDTGQLLLINPLLVAEVLSKSTRVYDHGDKFMKYKTLPSFREYLMIEQDEPYVEVWFRKQPGLWQETVVTGLSATIPLQSVGCTISMADIYENITFQPDIPKRRRRQKFE